MDGIEFERTDLSECKQDQQSINRIDWYIREMAKTQELVPDTLYWIDYSRANRN